MKKDVVGYVAVCSLVTVAAFMLFAPMVNISWVGAIGDFVTGNVVSLGCLIAGSAGSLLSAIALCATILPKSEAPAEENSLSGSCFGCSKIDLLMAQISALGASVITGFVGACMGTQSFVDLVTINPMYYNQTFLGAIFGAEGISLGLEGSSGILVLSTVIVPLIGAVCGICAIVIVH